MKASDLWSAPCLFVEFGQSAVKILDGEQGLELPLERSDNGRLTDSCRRQLVSRFQALGKGKAWGLRSRAFCAVGARGVSIRHLTLPQASHEELKRVLELQLESEFPLPPDQLAWGYSRLPGDNGSLGNGAPGQRLLVAAVKRELLEEYEQVLSQAGLSPAFTLSGIARTQLCPAGENYSLLEVGANDSEFLHVQNGELQGMRVLPWGTQSLTGALERSLGLSHDQAELLRIKPEQAPDPATQKRVLEAAESAVSTLVNMVGSDKLGTKFYVTGFGASTGAFLPALRGVVGPSVTCEWVPVQPGTGRSAATLGLRKLWEKNGTSGALVLRVAEETRKEAVPPPVRWHWAAIAILLLLASLSLRYTEAFLSRNRLARRLAQVKTYRQGLPRIDRELGFLQYLETNSPPLLDAFYVLAKAAPQGTRFEGVSMSRRGDFSVRGVMANAQQAMDFRSKLVDSAFFSSVVLDEQTPTPDRQRVNFRLSGQWKPSGQRPKIVPEPVAKDPNVIVPGMPGMMPGPGMPPPMMMGPGGGGPPPNMMAPPGVTVTPGARPVRIRPGPMPPGGPAEVSGSLPPGGGPVPVAPPPGTPVPVPVPPP